MTESLRGLLGKLNSEELARALALAQKQLKEKGKNISFEVKTYRTATGETHRYLYARTWVRDKEGKRRHRSIYLRKLPTGKE
jgi:hypothetical protein